MKIGSIIERNVFTFLWVFFLAFVLYYFISGESNDFDVKTMFCGGAAMYLVWPYIFFIGQMTSTLYEVSGMIVAGLTTLALYIIIDYWCRKIYWNRKKINFEISEDEQRNRKITLLKQISVICKWCGRLFACSIMPFLIGLTQYCAHDNDYNVIVCIYIAIAGCIVGWEIPFLGVIFLSIWLLPLHVKLWNNIFILFDALVILFFATGISNLLLKRNMRKFETIQSVKGK